MSSHSSRPATGAFATEGDQFLIMTGFTPNPEKTMINHGRLRVEAAERSLAEEAQHH